MSVFADLDFGPENTLVLDQDVWQTITNGTVVLESGSWNKVIWQELSKLREQNLFCDIQLLGNDGHAVPAHSCVVAAASSYLRSVLMQFGGLRKTDTVVTVEMPELTSDIITNILSFIYVGNFCISTTDLSSMAAAADLLHITELQQLCRLVQERHATALRLQQSLQAQRQKDKQQMEKIRADMAAEQQRLLLTIQQLQFELNQKHGHSINRSGDGQLDYSSSVSHDQDDRLADEDDTLDNPNVPVIEPPVDSMPYLDRDTVYSVEHHKIKVEDPQVSEELAVYSILEVKRDETEEYTVEINAEENTDVEQKQLPEDYSKHSCSVCHKTFKKTSHLAMHMLTHTNQRPWPCDECAMSFKSQYTLKAHKIRHGEKSVQCGLCSMLFYTKADLDSHMKQHTGSKPYVCNVCGKGFTQKCNMLSHKAAKHDTVRRRRQFECPQCGKTFITRQVLQRHLDRHGRKLTCEVCSHEFYHRSTLRKHLKEVHQIYEVPLSRTDVDGTVYQCLRCSKVCFSEQELAKHVDIVHDKRVKRFHCKYPSCSYQAYYQSQIRKHERTHLKWQPQPVPEGVSSLPLVAPRVVKNQCKICSKLFSNVKGLRDHFAMEHDIRTEFTHDFSSTSKDQDDRPSESMYLCDDCGKQCSSVTHLRSHKRTHTRSSSTVVTVPSQSLQCPECSRTFQQLSHLKKHIATVHRRQKRFMCTQCSHQCYFLSGMKDHFKRKHGGLQMPDIDEFLKKELLTASK